MFLDFKKSFRELSPSLTEVIEELLRHSGFRESVVTNCASVKIILLFPDIQDEGRSKVHKAAAEDVGGIYPFTIDDDEESLLVPCYEPPIASLGSIDFVLLVLRNGLLRVETLVQRSGKFDEAPQADHVQ